MKKNGILTFQFAHNYGAQLQAYALKEFLKKNQIDAEIINYTSDYFAKFYKFCPAFTTNLFMYLRRWKRTLLRLKQYKLFRQFAVEYLNVNLEKSFQDNKKISNSYESIVIGSDQVWNLNLTANDRTYYLSDINCPNKIAYAASFGENAIIHSLDHKDIMSLQTFNSISIREEESVSELEKRIKKKVECVIDPIFLLDYKEWKKLEKKPKGVKTPYICFIALKEDNVLVEQCKKLEDKSGLETLSIHPMCWKQKIGRQLFNVGPLEYLWLIDHADYIITNSFHAVAFSVLMNKKVISQSIDIKNNRISSLFSLFSDIQNQTGIIDFSRINKLLLNQQIEFSQNYLISNL